MSHTLCRKCSPKWVDLEILTVTPASPCLGCGAPANQCDVYRYDPREAGSVVLPVDPGTKHDSGKPLMSLLDSEFLEGVAEVLTFGAKKYAPHNWRGGLAYSRILSASLRHLSAILRGEDVDPETGLLHAHHIGCNMQFLGWMQTHRKDLDDRWKEPPHVAE